MPNEVALLRTSERNDFKRCPWLWEQTWLKGMGTRRQPVWSWFGTAVHAALEVRYPPGTKRGKVGAVLEAFEASVGEQTGRIWQDASANLEEEEVVDALELGKAMLIGYCDHYGNDQEWEVIHTEQPFQIDVAHPETGETLRVYAGTWDLFARNRITGEFWIWDHKTRKSFPSNWQFYNINDQAGSYLWVAPEVLRHLGLLKKKQQIEGLVFNTLKKHMPDNRPRNADGLATNKPQRAHYEAALSAAGVPTLAKATIAQMHLLATEAGLTVLGDPSANQPGELFHRENIYRSQRERVRQAQRVQQEALWMDDIRAGRKEAFKSPQEDCTRCKIFEYCEADEESPKAAKAIGKMLLTRRDYYADHNEAMTQKHGVDLTAPQPN